MKLATTQLTLVVLILFLQAATYTLTLVSKGTGKGTIIGTLDGDQVLNCGTLCSGKFLENSRIVLRVSANKGSYFQRWEGTGCQANPPNNPGRSELMIANVTCTAVFAEGNFPSASPNNLSVRGEK